MTIGIIVAGSSGSGKSSCIKTVVEAISKQAYSLSKSFDGSQLTTKLQRLYPLDTDHMSVMLGSVDQHGVWMDGIVTGAIRKSNRVNYFLCATFLVQCCKVRAIM